MAFLRKWGGSTGGNPAVNPSSSNGVGGAGGNGTGGKDGTPAEWYSDTPRERYFGMENFGNTCYANSVLQSLYFARPFRQLVESYQPYTPSSATLPSSSPQTQPIPAPTSPLLSNPALASSPPSSSASSQNGNARAVPPAKPVAGGGRGGIFSRQRQGSTSTSTSDASSAAPAGSPPFGPPLTHTLTNSSFTGVGAPVLQNGAIAREIPAAESTLLTAIRDLFVAISAQPKSIGTVAPQAFINQLKRDNEFFRSTLHQDAHEFLNFLVNALAEILEKEEKRRAEEEGRAPSVVGTGFGEHVKTWVHSLFEGILTNETRCLTCETVTSRDEAFLDLSIDIEQNSSVTSCLRQFSASEMLCQRNKFSCDKCCGLQEAEKRMKVKKLPNLLALHLKRFKYEESLQRHVKLTYRVVFPFELRLFNTADDISNPDRLYELWAIVVHIGIGPTHGHYITIVKSGAKWIVFDDNNVYPIEQSEICRYFGDTPGQGSAYCLFYQAVDIDSPFSGLPPQATEGLRPRATTASSASTGGVTGVSNGSKAYDDAPPIPPLPPASIDANLSAPPETIPDPSTPTGSIPAALVDPTKSLPSPIPRPSNLPPLQTGSTDSPSSLGNGLPPPSPIKQQRKPSLVSLSGSSVAGDRDSEKNGWSLKGRFTRTKSQATPSRSASGSAGTPNSSTIPLDPVPDVSNGGDGAMEKVAPSSSVSQDPPISDRLTASPNASPASRSTGLPTFASPARTNSTLPNEDDRESTISGSTAPLPHSPSQPFDENRRLSRLSMNQDVLSASTSSSVAPSPLLSIPPPVLSPSPPSTGALAATRNLFSRNKPRPQSSHGRLGLLSSSPSVGTGLGFSSESPNAGTSDHTSSSSSQPSNLAASLNKRPSTASPVVQSAGTFASGPRSASATNGVPLSNSTNPFNDPSSSSSSTDSPAPRHAPPSASPPLSKKEAEKKLKEEKKAREQEAKLREKQQKEQLKQMKEEAKRQEKLRRKMSTKG
ncbi:hypothetical protein JCM5353_006894 [Sporobolomyces roseus]